MPTFDRQQAITGAINMGATTDQINKSLVSVGQPELSRYERTLIDNNRYGQNIAQRLGSDVKEFAQGLSSLGGAIGQYAINPEFRSGVNQSIADYGKRLLTNENNLGEDIVNTFLTPYGTNLQQLVTNPKEALANAGANALAKPLNPILDSMTFTPRGAVAEAVSKLPFANAPAVRGVRTALLPTNREREINNILNLAEAKYASQTGAVEEATRRFGTNTDIEQAVRNLTLGTREGAEESTNQLLDFAKQMNERMVKLGLNPEDARQTAVNQRIMEIINPDRSKRISADDINKALDNPTADNLEKLGVTQDELNNLYLESMNLFDEGQIFPITQRGLNANEIDLINQIDNGQRLSGIQARRNIGTASIGEVARNLDRGYSLMYKDILDAQVAQDSLQEIAKRFGTRVENVNDVPTTGVNISPSQFNERVKELFATNKSNDLGDLAENTVSGLSGNSIKKYANDIYNVNGRDLEAFKNRFQGIDTSSGLGKYVQATRPLINAFKGTVLADAPYFFGNRTGNLLLNTIGGADYLGAWRRIANRTFRQDIPDYLRTSTSYFGQNPNLIDEGTLGTWRDTTRRIQRAAEDFKRTDDVADKINALGRMIGGVQDYVTRPLFQGESTFELIDRSAQYLKQAKDEAARLGVSTEDVIKLAKEDNDLQRRLIEGVNENLGDYIGRNYFINPTARAAAQTLFPFYRIFNTSRDVLRTQLAENPLNMQLMFRTPARVGYDLMRADVEANNQPTDSDTRGGITLEPSYSSNIPRTVIYNNYNPLLTPFELASSLLGTGAPNEGNILNRISDTLSGNLTPIRGLFNILQGEDAYGNPVVGQNTYRNGDNLITLDANGNKIEQSRDIAGTAVNYVRSNLLPVATLWNTTLGPALGSQTEQGFYQPTGRSIFGTVGQGVNIPYLYEGRNVQAPMSVGFPNWVASQVGFRTRDVYRPYQPRMNEQLLRTILRRVGRDRLIQQRRTGE